MSATAPSRPAGFMAAMVVDAVGSGVWITFSLLYFTFGRGMDLTEAGASLSAGALSALVLGGLAVGVVTDWCGPFSAAVVSCAMRAVAFPCYLVADEPLQVAVVAFVVSLGDRLYWAAHGGLVDGVTDAEPDRRRMFATMNSLRNIGLGVGALTVGLGASLEEFGATALWDVIPLVNSVSFAVAGVLFWRIVRLRPRWRSGRSRTRRRFSYRGVLANRGFVVFTAATLAITLSSVAFDSLLPVYLRSLDLPGWLPPIAYVLSCVAIPLFQRPALWLGHRQRALPLMALSAVLVAAGLVGLIVLGPLDLVAATSALSVLVLVFSLGEAIFGAVVMTVVLDFASAEDTGKYTAFYQLIWGLSGAFGPALHTSLFALSAVTPWIVLSGALLVAAAVYLRLARGERAPRPVAVTSEKDKG